MDTRALVMSLALVGVGCSSSSSSAPQAPLQSVEVKTVEGPVRGEIVDTVRAFRGIPYAAPPIGPNRWKAPQAVAPWTDTRDATQYGAACPQANLLTGAIDPATKEDCLTLNVWTPARATAKPAPVMVWIHGGAFVGGSGAGYDGARLVTRTQAVVVTINYRLGPLGFLGHSALAAEDSTKQTGNYGLLDQKAALEWVKRNIASFGGDPGNVTIFGESAGGISVALHVYWPASAGLFHRAIDESGPPALLQYPSLTSAEQMANDLAKALGCAAGDLACLRGKPASDLVTALHFTNQPSGGIEQGSIKSPIWWPVVDGVVLRKDLEQVIREDAPAHIPLLLGTNADEGRVFHAGLAGDIQLKSEAEYLPTLQREFGDAATAIAARYPASAFKSPNEALAKVLTLGGFRCPVRRLARASVRAGNPTYLYEFTRPTVNGTISSLGAVHASELPFLWDYESTLTGGPGEDGQPLVESMQDYWGRFAATGDPNGGSAVAWPKLDAADKHVVLDVPVTTGDSLSKDDCDFWDTQPVPAFPKTYD